LFLAPYPPGQSPSQRFRFEQYFQALNDAGHTFTVRTFLSEWGWKIIYSRGNTFAKFRAVFRGFLTRFSDIITINHHDFVFIHREAAPFGPPAFEWLIAKVFQKKIIYDFDDAIWLTDKKSEGALERMLRWRSKVASTCKWAYKVSCGNDYLCHYARQFNKNVVLNPTTIDTTYHKPIQKTYSDEIIVGWTGSHSTVKYLEDIIPAITAVEKKFPNMKFMVISDGTTSFNQITWKKDTEIEDLAKIDIGIMPLPDDEWSKGKCGFKALQYMAMEIPAVVSPVGVNTTIITNGVEGLTCKTTEDWKRALEQLITDAALRIKLGVAGRKKVDSNYSVASNTPTFLSLFDLSAINTSATR
jgi:glycosyltransferase involved in cell wall biosynthesis